MPFIKFTLLRFGVALAVFALCAYLRVGLVMAAIVGLIVSWAVGYLFFPALREQAAGYLQRRYSPSAPHRMKSEEEDAAAEDRL
ncbi:DUF4229 domain-containing protein [Falsarthrobacter nasiphocae]|uniref:DUF4229 domain-containing protein n=1 Tax=Falsarthrobacter nasiphocae TaxID=189863 RepID=A0AAE3YI61_9MICC|nr:DUF4229 domain-containing protein [Falsarthrobacter nasiphocae]MDR6892378.1 hypothetical protein [Falsarthrobacter nasiphocae]